MRYFIFIVIGIVAATIVAGFFIVDSPKEVRLRKFDEQRAGDLQIIQGEIINYWTKKGVLPKTLSDLKDDVKGFFVPVDPESGEQYRYETSGKYEFSLCATFARESGGMYSNMPKRMPIPHREFGGYLPVDFQYIAGRVCFSRTIDPELYPVNKQEFKR